VYEVRYLKDPFLREAPERRVIDCVFSSEPPPRFRSSRMVNYLRYLKGLLIPLLLSTGITDAQEILWVRTYDRPNLMEQAHGVATDREGNVIVTGYAEVEEANYDYHTMKYDTDGELLWTKTYDGGGLDWAYGVVADKDDNVIVTGCSDRGGDYDYRYCTVKYTPDGDTIWIHYGPSGWAYGVATDREGNIIVTGSSGDPSTKASGCYTMKYSPDGDTLWTRFYYSEQGSRARGVATDGRNNIVVTGMYWNELDYLTIKYGPNGTILWTRTYDDYSDEHAHAVATDRGNNIIVTGTCHSPTEGSHNYYTVKYSRNGDILWAREYDGGGKDFAYGVATDTAGNILVTGRSWLGKGYGYCTLKYDPDGGFLWRRIYESGGNCARGVATDLENNVIVTGYSWGGTGDTHFCTVKYSGATDVGERNSVQIVGQELHVYSNPLNVQTTIQYGLAHDTRVDLGIYDLLGREIRVLVDQDQSAGVHTMIWDGRDDSGRRVPSGSYFLRLEAGEYSATRKLCVVR
jgi:uncharacterized delta-60 repeat protein